MSRRVRHLVAGQVVLGWVCLPVSSGERTITIQAGALQAAGVCRGSESGDDQGGGPGFAGHAVRRGAFEDVWLDIREHCDHGCAGELPCGDSARERIDYLATVG